MRKRIITLATGLVLSVNMAVFADTAQDLGIGFVTIGGAGNAADSSGYGAVGYNYRIGVREISVGQYAASGASEGTPNESYWSNPSRLGTNSAPVVRTSFTEAAKFCNYLTSGDVNTGAYTISGGQVTAIMSRSAMLSDGGTFYVLPTADEWYKAAYFKNGSYSLYANGTSTAPIAGTEANYGGSSAWTVDQGAVEQNGTVNMMGNVFEWTESAFDGSLGLPVNEDMVLFGGRYNSPVAYLSSAQKVNFGSSSEDISIGIRVVAIPEPGTISLMSLSTIGLFLTRTVRRRRRIGASLIPVRRVPLCDSFTSEAEWRASAAPEQEQRDWFAAVTEELGQVLAAGWERVSTAYASVNRAFWDRSVARYERRLQKRMEFRANMKKRMLDGLDAFLAKIMK